MSRIPEAEKRIIGLSVFASGNFVAVEVHNTFAVAPEFENGMPKTTKAERELHGYGVKSIKLIAEKYGGDLTLGVRDGLFNLNVLLPKNKRQTCAE